MPRRLLRTDPAIAERRTRGVWSVGDGRPELARWVGRPLAETAPEILAAHGGDPTLEALGLARWFAVMAGPGLNESEGRPATLARALQRLGATAGPQHVMVADRRHDIEAGRANGITTIGVTWDFGTADELRDAGADAVVDTPDRLVGTVAANRVRARTSR
jgi:hypothetical protein